VLQKKSNISIIYLNKIADIMKFYITEDDMCTTQKLNLARVQKWIIKNGGLITDDIYSADHILCQTCNGWSLLEDNSYQRIKKIQKKKLEDKMIVMGCVNDAHPEKVKKIFNGRTVRTKSESPLSFSEIENFFPDFKFSLSQIPAQSIFRRKEDYRDYNLKKRFINIAEGCSFNCSFCTHKPGLGERRSRPLDDILQQIRQCTKEGVEVINLMGMETSLWGIELGLNYPILVNEILKIKGDFQIHVAQFQPTGIKRYYDDLLKAFSNKRFTDIQLPIQTTSKRIMRMMKRQELSAFVGPFIKELRKKNIRALLRTDLIICWPTETKEERYDSLDFAGKYFDEISLYTIELNKDLPAWEYKDDAYSLEEMNLYRSESKKYLEAKYPGVVVSTGQQEEDSMETAEAKRINLRKFKASL
tara:strand:- start:752 stop:1999 length:1248 start_codon:yes stop_codon:yes gene_type:complete